eukprot:7381782-Prymnesium_polylepis.1
MPCRVLRPNWAAGHHTCECTPRPRPRCTRMRCASAGRRAAMLDQASKPLVRLTKRNSRPACGQGRRALRGPGPDNEQALDPSWLVLRWIMCTGRKRCARKGSACSLALHATRAISSGLRFECGGPLAQLGVPADQVVELLLRACQLGRSLRSQVAGGRPELALLPRAGDALDLDARGGRACSQLDVPVRLPHREEVGSDVCRTGIGTPVAGFSRR